MQRCNKFFFYDLRFCLFHHWTCSRPDHTLPRSFTEAYYIFFFLSSSFVLPMLIRSEIEGYIFNGVELLLQLAMNGLVMTPNLSFFLSLYCLFLAFLVDFLALIISLLSVQLVIFLM